jgi:isopentenyl diphosphate isomerase/L-lactate dehydrogenase-like FMN-dependent dehydrogenase
VIDELRGSPPEMPLSESESFGVERVLDILNNELRLAMIGCGANEREGQSPAGR